MSDEQVLDNEMQTETENGVDEPVETSGEVVNDEAENTGDTEESIDEESTEESQDEPVITQKQLGALLAKERLKERAKEKARYEAQMSQQIHSGNAPLMQAPPGTIYDAETEEYVAVDTPEGAAALRAQKIAAVKAAKEEARRAAEKQAEYADAREKINEGFDKFDNFYNSFQTFQNLGTDAMAEGLLGVDDPAAIINYLATKQGELKRISSLPRRFQAKEVHKIEDLLQPKKRLVTQAKPLPTATKPAMPKGTSVGNLSDKDSDDYWYKYYNTR